MAKSSSKKKSPAKKKSASKAKSSPKAKKTTTAKGAAASKAKAGKSPPKKGKQKVSRSDLLLRKFDDWQPEALYTPPKEDHGEFKAPPIAEGPTADAVRALLLKRFDAGASPTGQAKPKKKAAPKEKAAAKPPAKKKTAAPVKKAAEAPAPPKAPVSTKELLARKFDAWVPEKPYAPPPVAVEIPPAPPIAAGADEERIKGLLRKQFDLHEMTPPPEPAAPDPADSPPESDPPAAAAEPVPEREPVSISELIHRRFDSWRPDTPYVPTETPAEVPAAPPIAAGPEAERIKGLLLRPIDLSDIPPASEPEPAPAAEEAGGDAVSEPEPAESVTESALAVPETAAASEETAAEMRETAGQVVRPEPVYRPDAEWEASGLPEEEKSEAQVPPIPPQKKGSDPMERSMKFLAACAIVLFAIILGTSFSNASKYYLKSTDDGLEIWKGSFGPMGKERVVRLEGVAAPESIQGVYEEDQVLPIAFNYYMDKARDLLYSQGVPSFDQVREHIDHAMEYASGQTAKRAIAMKNKMKSLRLITMADIAASKGTPEGIQEAIAYLERAAELDSEALIETVRADHLPIIQKKMAAYKDLLAAATPETETEEAAQTE